MPFNLTTIDRQLIRNNTLSIALEDVNPVDDFPSGGGRIVFQFPPNITSDSKGAKWQEIYNIPAYEPQFMYTGGKPRNISIKTIYVVGGPREGLANRLASAITMPFAGNISAAAGGVGTGWTTVRVAEEIRRWKSYFYVNNVALGSRLPIYRIVWHQLLPSVGPDSAWRGIDYKVKYSDTVISDDAGEHPLITEVSVNLAQVSQIGTNDDEEKRMDLSNLPDTAKQQWY
jgi:hypothetical protein